MFLFKTKRTFRKEFKRQLKMAIIAAIGFSIAFAWRNSIFSLFQNFLVRFFDLQKEHYLNEIYTSIAITIAGVLIILLTSKIFKGD